MPYFGGYLSLIAIGQMLIFVYLLLFYCKPINKSKNLFKLRFICIITICISIIVVVMIMTKTIQYIRQTQVKDDKYYLIVVTNIMDILITKNINSSYLFITICHYRQLQSIRTQNTNPIETERQQINNYIQGRVEENIQIQVEQEGVDNVHEINLNSL